MDKSLDNPYDQLNIDLESCEEFPSYEKLDIPEIIVNPNFFPREKISNINENNFFIGVKMAHINILPKLLDQNDKIKTKKRNIPNLNDSLKRSSNDEYKKYSSNFVSSNKGNKSFNNHEINVKEFITNTKDQKEISNKEKINKSPFKIKKFYESIIPSSEINMIKECSFKSKNKYYKHSNESFLDKQKKFVENRNESIKKLKEREDYLNNLNIFDKPIISKNSQKIMKKKEKSKISIFKKLHITALKRKEQSSFEIIEPKSKLSKIRKRNVYVNTNIFRDSKSKCAKNKLSYSPRSNSLKDCESNMQSEDLIQNKLRKEFDEAIKYVNKNQDSMNFKIEEIKRVLFEMKFFSKEEEIEQELKELHNIFGSKELSKESLFHFICLIFNFSSIKRNNLLFLDYNQSINIHKKFFKFFWNKMLRKKERLLGHYTDNFTFKPQLTHETLKIASIERDKVKSKLFENGFSENYEKKRINTERNMNPSIHQFFAFRNENKNKNTELNSKKKSFQKNDLLQCTFQPLINKKSNYYKIISPATLKNNSLCEDKKNKNESYQNHKEGDEYFIQNADQKLTKQKGKKINQNTSIDSIKTSKLFQCSNNRVRQEIGQKSNSSNSKSILNFDQNKSKKNIIGAEFKQNNKKTLNLNRSFLTKNDKNYFNEEKSIINKLDETIKKAVNIRNQNKNNDTIHQKSSIPIISERGKERNIKHYLPYNSNIDLNLGEKKHIPNSACLNENGKRLLFKLNIQLNQDPNQNHEISIYEGDSPEKIAYEFCINNHLPEDIFRPLSLIIENEWKNILDKNTQ